MKAYIRLLLLSALFAGSVHAQAAATGETSSSQQQQQQYQKAPPAWEKKKFPNPQLEPSECRTATNRLCDPDGILIDMERQRVIQRIDQLETKHSIGCGNNPATGNTHEIQMSVALANRMYLLRYGSDRAEEAAQDFAIHLHNEWGVGVDTNGCGGTGMLLFFSIRDRAFFLSRGKALEPILTDSRVARIMERSVKPLLRQERYAEALLELIDSLDHYLTKGAPTKSELRQEWLANLVPIGFIALCLSMMGWQFRNERRETRNYAHVASQLTQLDRDRAEALQGRYECKSCPICLEEFQTEEEATAEAVGEAEAGSVGEAGGEEATTGEGATTGDEAVDVGTTSEQQRPTRGSDGLPLKLLRCGHVFDETCWSEWVSSGTGNIRRCPICQQDVASTNEHNAATATQEQPHQHQGQQANQVHNNFADNRVFRQFHRERNFRLARLGMRFPRYVGQQQLNSWTQSNYDGTLARDPGFLRNDPRVMQQNRQNAAGRRGGGSSFGGGSSGGGHGGSW